MNKIFTPAVRKWIYGIAIAAMPIIGGYLGIQAAEQEQYLNLIAAILLMAGGPMAGLARSNVNSDDD